MSRLGISQAASRKYLTAVEGGAYGLGPDALSAYTDYAFDLLHPLGDEADSVQMFPGGNAGIARLMVKTLNPAAIEGEHSIEGVHQGRVRFDLLDVPDAAARVRLSSTVVSVRHDGDPKTADSLSVSYFRAGKLYRVKARSAVIAGGSWTAKHIVKDLPAEYAERRGYGLHTDFGGHGVGRTMHESPSVPNDGRPGRGLRLRPGLTIAIEPWFLAGGLDAYRVDPDGWTLRSTDGSRGAHFEHTIAVTDDGPRVLTAWPDRTPVNRPGVTESGPWGARVSGWLSCWRSPSRFDRTAHARRRRRSSSWSWRPVRSRPCWYAPGADPTGRPTRCARPGRG